MTPQQSQILNMLADGKFHCPTIELFMKDDRRRFTDLRQMGYIFDSPRCNMGHNHNSGVVMRKLVSAPSTQLPEAQNAPNPIPKVKSYSPPPQNPASVKFTPNPTPLFVYHGIGFGA